MSANPQATKQSDFPTEASASRPRLDSIDLLRGIVMVLMMLDHTRDFVHNAVTQFDPTDPTHTNVALFFTRWLTHFCAPAFIFLAGTSAYLQLSRGKTKRELSWFLVTRGVWLIILEVTLVRFGVTFSVSPEMAGFLQVIWVIGVSMIVLAALIHLPRVLIAAFGLILIAGHNLLDSFRVTSWRGPGTPFPSFAERLWIFLHQAFEAFPILWFFPSPVLVVVYPLIPWVGVMAAGFVFGSLYVMEAVRRRKLLLIIGGIASILFVVIRVTNLYGDPTPWETQRTVVYTVLSFLNTQKYPPSLLYLLMTLGPAIISLALFERRSSKPRNVVERFFITFGRVPLFFYLLQWYTAHLISLVLHFLAGKSVAWMFRSPMDFAPVPDRGFNLVIVYLSWIAGIALLYPLCKWFAGVKQRRKDWWLSYL